MNKEFFADSCTNVARCNPHVFELGSPISQDQSVEADNLVFTLRNIDLIVADEIWRDGEVGPPVLNPVLRITPIPLGIMSDLGQSSSFVWRCLANYHR